ncbi:MAG: proline dehydrogenase family protein [Bacteroidales bacterium]
MQLFTDSEIAFSSKSIKELKQAFWLFKTLQYPLIVNIGNKMLSFAIFVKFPINWMIKPTIFKHFCGGETIIDCDKTINLLGNNKIGSILDYSAEGNEKEADFDFVMNEVLEVIEKSKSSPFIPFAVFKVTGLARLKLLEKINAKLELTESEKTEFIKVQQRIDCICNAAYQADIPVLIDAEESWIQQPIDDMSIQMMQKYNRNRAIVYNTLQMYRNDRIDFLHQSIVKAKEQAYFIGFKLVRGAYMEKERERALLNGYPSPIHINKEFTDHDYNKAVEICFANADRVSICAGSHNEESNALLATLIEENKIKKDDNRFYFAQLLGMSDHISYNLSHNGYNVAKYVPFGPVKSVMPYLIRRAQENTSIAGQSLRELDLIRTEIKRRKSLIN